MIDDEKYEFENDKKAWKILLIYQFNVFYHLI